MLGDILNRFFDDIDFRISILLHYSRFADRLDERHRAAIQDRHFCAIDGDKTVVNAHCIKGRQGVLYSRDAPLSVLEHRTTFRCRHIIRVGMVRRLVGQIGSAQTDSEVLLCGCESSMDVNACM